MRQLADRLEQLPDGFRVTRERYLGARGWIEPALLSQVADRADDVDEGAEAFLQREITLARLRPRRDHERGRVVGFAGALPELHRDRLGEEGHRRMQETQRPVERVRERAHGLARVRGTQRGLCELDIEVGKLIPDEALERHEILAEEVTVDEARR